MASYRVSVAFDIQADHDLIDRLVELQKSKDASAVVREALRAYFGMTGTLDQVLAEVREVKALLSSGGIKVAQPSTQLTAPADASLDAKLGKALSRFKKGED